MEQQRTIHKKVNLSGKGLHTGNKVDMTLSPAPVNTGVVFIRTDLPGAPRVKADIDNLLSQDKSVRRTSIGSQGAEVHTIEHLMSVLSGIGVDNLYVELNNNEVPGFDGSGEVFIDAILRAGLDAQDAARKYYLIKEPIFVEEEGSIIAVLPASEYRISYTLSYNHPVLKAQFLDLSLNPDEFRLQIASARTFCLEDESHDLQEKGLGKGANYDNTLVVGKDGVIKNRLRYQDEFVRHKILDLIGDLSLLGMPIHGHVFAVRSGHQLNMKLLRRIIQQREKYSLGALKAEYHPRPGEELDIKVIMKVLPHRYPFLLVDKIIQMEAGKRAVGVKNVTMNEHFFQGHFPGKPIMPGVLIIEALAQVGGVLILSPEEHRGRIAYFMSINNVKFRKPVVPGDVLFLEVEVGKIKSRTGQLSGRAVVDGKVVAEADLMFALADE